MSPEIWNFIFMVIRYVAVPLVLAYLAYVYVKRRDIFTDIKGRVLESRLVTYKSIHRWVMKFKSVIAAPSQNEEHYWNILSITRFKIGYQGMEYAVFFDTPERLFEFRMSYNQMMNKEEDCLDYPLRNELVEFGLWLDDVTMFLGTFVKTECDKRWKFDEDTIKRHCNLVCRLLGIALQKDVDWFYHKIDISLRDRLRNIKIAGVYSESCLTKCRRKICEYCENVMDKEEDSRCERIVRWFYYHFLYRYYGCRSQLHRNNFGLMTIFVLVHFEEHFTQSPELMNNRAEFMRLTTEYNDCYSQYLERWS